jgi:hypothetical protein
MFRADYCTACRCSPRQLEQIPRCGSARADRIPHSRRLDGEEPARCDATPPPALRRPWREADRRDHRDHALLPFLATVDFPHGELVLRRKDATNLEQLVAASGARASRFPSGLQATISWLAGGAWRHFHLAPSVHTPGNKIDRGAPGASATVLGVPNRNRSSSATAGRSAAMVQYRGEHLLR